MGVLVSGVSSSIIRGQRLVSHDMMAKGSTSGVGVVLERHDGDDGDSSQETDCFYPPKSRTIPEVV